MKSAMFDKLDRDEQRQPRTARNLRQENEVDQTGGQTTR